MWVQKVICGQLLVFNNLFLQWGRIDTPSNTNTKIYYNVVFNQIYLVQSGFWKANTGLTIGLNNVTNSCFTWYQNAACMWLAIGI